MKHGRWSKFFRERAFLTVMLLALVLLTVVTICAVYSRSREDGNENQYLNLDNSTEEGLAVNAPNNTNEALTDDVPTGYEVGQEELANGSTADSDNTSAAGSSEAAAANSGNIVAINLAYDGAKTLQWPVKGEVLMDYSMDTTVYYATLRQYKVSPAVLLQGEVGQNVVSPADAQVVSVGTNEEIGNFIVLQLGNTYQATIGNLENLTVAEGQYILKGTVLGTLAQPTKYYSIEGPNLYFQVTNSESAVDPLDYLE